MQLKDIQAMVYISVINRFNWNKQKSYWRSKDDTKNDLNTCIFSERYIIELQTEFEENLFTCTALPTPNFPQSSNPHLSRFQLLYRKAFPWTFSRSHSVPMPTEILFMIMEKCCRFNGMNDYYCRISIFYKFFSIQGFRYPFENICMVSIVCLMLFAKIFHMLNVLARA